MQSVITPFTDTPDKFLKQISSGSKSLVIKGGEVGGAALVDNITNARILAIYRKRDWIVGVTALKRPKASYREKIERRLYSGCRSALRTRLHFSGRSLQGRRMSFPLAPGRARSCGWRGCFCDCAS